MHNMIGNRLLRQAVVFLSLAGLVGLTAFSSLAAQRPNILLILTDDQGWSTLGCYGGKIVPTPNLDRLAAEGARFTDAYVTSQCTPTRATILSGQYTARNHMWHVIGWYGLPWAPMEERPFVENLPRDAFTIAKGLKRAGYATGIMGKWHLTNNADGHYMGLKPEAAHHYGFGHAPPILPRSEFKKGNDRGVDELTDQAIEFIANNRDRPWFCYLSHHMIHGVVVAPEPLTRKYRDLGFGDDGYNKAVYLAGLEHIDRSIGRLMAKLNDLGEARDTLVVFLSDNGGIDERLEHRSMSLPHPDEPELTPDLREYDNAPLRAGKGSVYEGGVRVPLIVRWPGRVRPGTIIETPVHGIDLTPTFLEVAGARAPEGQALDGIGLAGLLQGEPEPSLSERPIFQYMPFYDLNWGLTPCASVRLGDFKLIEFFGDRFDAKNRYVPGHHLELFNLRRDLGETRNLAESDAGRAGELQRRLRQWMRNLGVEPSSPNPHHDSSRAFLTTNKKPAWIQ